MSRRSAFTLIELLVVTAIIAILSVVVILAINPAELLRQSRDSTRLSDLATINTALSLYSEDAGGSMGVASNTYISIFDPSATSTAGDQCQGLGIPSESGFAWQCAASTSYKGTGGTGWIPLALKNISSGSPIATLPVDPINQSTTGLFYAYTTNGNQYEVTAAMESTKYRLGGTSDAVSTDGGSKVDLHEVGTNLALAPLDYGALADPSLVSYFPLDEGTSTIAYDWSSRGGIGSWSGTPTGTIGYYSPGKLGPYSGAFDGNTDYIIGNKLVNLPSGATVSAWVYLPTLPSTTVRIVGLSNFGNGGGYYDKIISVNSVGSFVFYVKDGNGSEYTSSYTVPAGQWMFLAGTEDGATARAYFNGTLVGTTTAGFGQIGYTTPNILIGGYDPSNYSYPNALIDDVRVYNRALSAAEIQALYSAEK